LNSESVQLGNLKRAEQCPKARGREDLHLDVEPTAFGYEFFARDDNDNVICEHTDLVGAIFEIRKGSITKELRISQIGKTEVEQPDLTLGNSSPMERAAYLITPFDQPANSLCTSLAPEAAATPTPILNTKNGELSVIESEDLASYAIIIPGAVYDYKADLIPGSLATLPSRSNKPEAQPHRWFNIACASDGLAQTELSGLATDPISGLLTALVRLPALHMFTAKYCNGISATLRGTPIRWSTHNTFARRIFKSDLGPIEAQWGSNGATCLRHSRLWIPNKAISLPSQLLHLWPFSNLSLLKLPMDEEAFLTNVQKMCTTRSGQPDSRLPESDERDFNETKGLDLNKLVTFVESSTE
jgi:hypothetical protein